MWYLEIRSTRSLKKELREERESKFEEVIKIRYERHYKFINIEDAGDNDTLNHTAEKYHDEGYDLDREKSTDRLLVFVKREEVKED
jgi:hypothetical protein